MGSNLETLIVSSIQIDFRIRRGATKWWKLKILDENPIDLPKHLFPVEASCKY